MISAKVLPKRYVPVSKKPIAGGMSEAILCEDTHLERKVIVKSLQVGGNQKRLLDELSALLAIRSKYVVQIFDVIRTSAGTIIAIVEEFLPGHDLLTIAAPKTAHEALQRLYPMAAGIASIHGQGRIHRDIKPNNVKYDAENCLKIFDFGLARIDGVNSSTVGALGTPGFMAPELFQSTGSGTVHFTQAIDTFAFGATALLHLSGGLPLTFLKLPPNPPASPKHFAAAPQKLPAEVRQILDDCLQPDPADRPLMSRVCNVLGAHLLHDRHTALLVHNGQSYVLNAKNRSVNLASSGRGSMKIVYDGIRFLVRDVSGQVAINNLAVPEGFEIPGACVIVLGGPELGSARVNITVDIAHPDVTV